MARTQSISLDVGGHDVVAHFGGIEEVRSMVLSPAFVLRLSSCCGPAVRGTALQAQHDMLSCDIC